MLLSSDQPQLDYMPEGVSEVGEYCALPQNKYIPSLARKLPSEKEVRPILLIDFHGTICNTHFWNDSSPEIQKQINQVVFRDKDFSQQWMRGQVSSHYVCAKIGDEIGLSKSIVFNSLINSCENFLIEDSILSSLLRLRERYTLILLTANADCFRIVNRSLGLPAIFDDIICSSDVGLLKEDCGGAIFRHIQESLEVPMSHISIIDDSASACQSLKRLGGVAYHISDQNSFENVTNQLVQ